MPAGLFRIAIPALLLFALLLPGAVFSEDADSSNNPPSSDSPDDSKDTDAVRSILPWHYPASGLEQNISPYLDPYLESLFRYEAGEGDGDDDGEDSASKSVDENDPNRPLTEEEQRELRGLYRQYRNETMTRYRSKINLEKNRQKPQRLEVRATYDNDILIKNAAGGDRGYTNGIHFISLWRSRTDPDSILGKWRDREKTPIRGWFLQLFDTEAGTAVPRFGVVAGQSIYTPENLKQRSIVDEDRPYAGWLYTGIAFELQGVASTMHIEAHVGGTGDMSLAEEMQTFVHENTSSAYPRGWKNQIATGVGVNAYTTVYHHLFHIQSPKKTGIPIQLADAQLYARTALGTFLNSQSVGTLIRVGFVRQSWETELRTGEIVPDRKIPKHFRAAGFDMTQVYLFARIQTELVLYNSAIQGLPFTDNVHTTNIQPIVDEGELGIVIQPLNCFDFVLSVVHRTQETRKGITDFGGHSWGHLQLGYHWF